MSEYTDRRIEEYTLGVIVPGDDGWAVVHTKEGTGFSRLLTDLEGLEPDDVFELETQRGSFITGLRHKGKWLFRKTDQELRDEHEEWKRKLNVEREEALERGREDWAKREAALPEWSRIRIAKFHETGGHEFELSGWAYELAICELAALYVESKLEDTDAVMKYARDMGTSGNQHDFAKLLARVQIEQPELESTDLPSALSPISGDLDYSGKKGS